MSRLPIVGQDNNDWGNVLNDYLSVSHTDGGRNKSIVTSIDYASSITPNIDTTDIVQVGTLTGDITISNPTGTSIDGQLLTLRLLQDGTGLHTVSFDTSYAFNTSTVPTLPTDANARYELSFRYNTTTSLWEYINLVPSISSSSEEFETVSRAIYYATTGSDTTGSGTVGSPYASPLKCLQSIKSVINTGVTITIQGTAGSYSVDGSILENEFRKKTQLGTAQILWTGGYTVLASGFTLSAQNPAAYVYNVTGATFSSNQYQDKLLRNNNNYYGIISNTTNTINTVTGASAATQIVEFSVIWNITNGLTFHSKYPTSPISAGQQQQGIIFELMQLNFGSADAVFSVKSLLINIRRAQIIAGSLNFSCTTIETTTINTSSIVLSTGGLTISPSAQIRMTTIRKSGAKSGTGIVFDQYTSRNQHCTYVDNFTNGIQIGAGMLYNQSGGDLILSNCTNGITLKTGGSISMTSLAKLYINNVDYLLTPITETVTFYYDAEFYTVVGSPNTGWLSSTLATNGFSNPAKGILITIPGVATYGKATLVGGTVTVNTAAVQATSMIMLTRDVVGGTIGDLSIGTKTVGTSFVINSSNASDTSTVSWQLVGAV